MSAKTPLGAETSRQAEIDEAEWRNPANWHGGWFGIYFSRKDSRGWVPKKGQDPQGIGATVNFAKPAGVLTFLLMLVPPFAVLLLYLIFR